MADWLPDWHGQTVAILGGGPSLKQADVDRLKGRARVIAINDAWRVCPWADWLYACDKNWWRMRGPKPGEFAGLRVGLIASKLPDVLATVTDACPWSTMPGVVVTGSNSGFQAMQLAEQAGGDPILLLGFDMNVKAGVHWHGKHPQPLSNPTPVLCEKWRKAFDEASAFITAKIINCTPKSALTCFPIMPVDEAIGNTRQPARGRTCEV